MFLVGCAVCDWIPFPLLEYAYIALPFGIANARQRTRLPVLFHPQHIIVWEIEVLVKLRII